MSTSQNIATMIPIRNLAILSILILTIWSCSKNEISTDADYIGDHAMIYQELLSMEFAILNAEYTEVLEHSKNLDMLLKDGYKLFCANESAQIDGARLTNRILAQNIEKNKTGGLLDDLRILKGTIIHLVSDDDYDPYFAFLWRFEEDMHATTEIAMDPMLDLYEWNEFLYTVDCMNDSWRPLQMHFPSPEILNHDPVKFKNQSKHKIYLEQALEKFNKAVSVADSEQYPLCESAESLRKAYYDYINTFIESMRRSDSFLAIL